MKQQTEEAGEVLPANMVLADEESLERIKSIKSPELEGLADDENIWEKILNFKDRAQRKKYKLELLKPIVINSKYAFNIKNRDFKIKKYLNVKNIQKNDEKSEK